MNNGLFILISQQKWWSLRKFSFSPQCLKSYAVKKLNKTNKISPGINTLTLADVKLPTRCQYTKSWEEMRTVGSCQPVQTTHYPRWHDPIYWVTYRLSPAKLRKLSRTVTCLSQLLVCPQHVVQVPNKSTLKIPSLGPAPCPVVWKPFYAVSWGHCRVHLGPPIGSASETTVAYTWTFSVFQKVKMEM